MSQNSRPASATEVMNLRREIQQAEQQRGGPLSQHARDVRNLKPEIAGIDAIDLYCDVTSGGVVTQPTKQTTPGGFFAELFEVRGYMQLPGTDPELSGTIFFNIRDTKRSSNMFSTDIMMGQLVDTAGGGQPMEFQRGLYVFDPGTDIKATFTVDGDATLGYANQAGASKRWGILLRFNLFAV